MQKLGLDETREAPKKQAILHPGPANFSNLRPHT